MKYAVHGYCLAITIFLLIANYSTYIIYFNIQSDFERHQKFGLNLKSKNPVEWVIRNFFCFSLEKNKLPFLIYVGVFCVVDSCIALW
jgi:hypothetical protein